MFSTTLIIFLVASSVQAQLNGEFWWLNSKLNNLRNVRPSLPKIEISDYQNDDSAKIIFRDDRPFTDKISKPITDRTSNLQAYENIDENKIVWPSEVKNQDVEILNNDVKENVEIIKPSKIQKDNKDVFVFSFPKNEKHEPFNLNTTTIKPNISTSTQKTLIIIETSNHILSHSDNISTTPKNQVSQNICTYITNKECDQMNGLVYLYSRRLPTTFGAEPIICCVLPIAPTPKDDRYSNTIYFPDEIKSRHRRNTEENAALKQREFLLKHKFSNRQLNLKPVSTPQTKIVTPPEDDYIDPYWNIKNINFHNLNKPKIEKTNHDYYEDYVQEYTDELPRPGLVGLYSDHAKAPSSWFSAGDNKGFGYGGSDEYDDGDEDNDDTFGYSTVDPRKGDKKQKHKVNTLKLSTSSDEVAYDAESQTINFQSNPDFHVLQGFKLLNLVRNTSRTYTKNAKKSTNNNNKEILVARPDESQETDDEVIDKNQLFNGCGKAVAKNTEETDKKTGDAANRSHPWMALVVLTKRRHNVLCYATLVHPRAAVTIADCVHGTAPGDISVIAGLWDLNDRTRSKNRVATVHVHPKYKAGDLQNNLAILYWMHPLKLSANIQPACLGEPQIGEECKFFGWGGLDQGIQQPRSRWQRASILTCSTRFGVDKRTKPPAEAFCVTGPRGAVTGMGGPLICDVDGHTSNSVVGVVVSRHNEYVLLPVRDWAMKAAELLAVD